MPAPKPAAPASAGTTPAAAIGAAATPAAAAAAAAAPAAPGYDTLPVGLELAITLQEFTDEDLEVRHVGTAKVRVEQLLGQGGQADVYLCTNLGYKQKGPQPAGSKKLQLQVVVKMVRPPPETDERARQAYVDTCWNEMLQEHNIVQQLAGCRSVVNTYGFGMAASTARNCSSLYGIDLSRPCILFEKADRTLLQQLAPEGIKAPMCELATKKVLLAMVEALGAVQSLGYVHRDVKPDNVLVFDSPDGSQPTYKLADFGLATKREERNDGTAGTPYYMPPEELWQPSSDTYALGKLLLVYRSAALPLPGTYAELRDAGAYSQLSDGEWDLISVCFSTTGSRPRPDNPKANTTYFTSGFLVRV
jgi:serine/threonine protein kinase